MQSTHLLLEEPIRMASILESSKPNFFPAMTKIVGTLGPKSRSVQVISDCLRAGMSVARFDFSQGDPQYHQQTLANLKVAVKATKKLCAVMLDTIGPELQVVNKNETPVTLEAAAFVVLTPHTDQEATSTLLPINFDGLAKAVKQGDTIFVGQYLFTGSESTSVWLEVSEVKGNDLGIFLVTLSFLLLLAILVILTGHGSVLRSLIQNEISSSSSSNETAPFPWTETMLSFQRTAYHYQPERNWMSDPNGPMFYNGWYHLYNLVLSSEIPMSGADSSKMWIRN